MKLSADDPKLTAYALGELDAVEAAEVERELQASPELRQAVEEIREASDWLKKELAAEEFPARIPEQRKAVEGSPSNVVPLHRRVWQKAAGFAAIAAAIVLGAWIGFQNFRSPGPGSPVSEVKAKVPPFRYAQNAERHSLSPSSETLDQKQELAPAVPVINQMSSLKTDAPQPKTESISIMPLPEKESPKAAPASPVSRIVASSSISESKLSSVASDTAAKIAQPAVSNPEVSASLHRTLSKQVAPQPAPSAYAFAGKDFSAGKANSFYRQDPPSAHRRQSAEVLSKERENDRRREISNELAKKYLPTHPIMREALRHIAPVEHRDHDTARYPRYVENVFESVLNNPLSTFSVDVDTASYANVRRFLNERRMPPRDAVRVEEMINYFSYSYPQPRDDEPFAVSLEAAECPWKKTHRLVRIGLKGKEIAQNKRPASNFVFLIDVSGSMSPENRLPLIKQALRMLVKRMTENDRIAMVVYASNSGVVLESISCMNKEKILEAIDELEAGGSTNGGEGIQKAYRLAEENFIKGGVNRVILATDGDFNVGITSQDELIDLIERKAKSGVFLSALGVGTDNYKDAMLQKLADKGNGNYHYLDSLEEAEKVLIQQMNGTLVTIAKDVKVQIEFNPAQVRSYRLIGYEKRILEAEDFNDDRKDAGEIGAGHTVTALYEIIPAHVEDDDEFQTVAEDLKYQPKREKKEKPVPPTGNQDELLTVKLRYKKSAGKTSQLSEYPLRNEGKQFNSASDDFRFATAVAGFGMLLKNSEYKRDLTFDQVLQLAQRAKGEDKEGYRAEFINLVKKARQISDDR